LRDRQFKTVLSFDTSSLPAQANLVSATVRLQRGNNNRTNPFDGGIWGPCWADVMTGGFSGSTALQRSDFEAAATAPQAAYMSSPQVNYEWSEGTLDAAGLAAIALGGTTQFRIECQLDDDDDTAGDNLGFYSGNAPDPASWPQLVVTYME